MVSIQNRQADQTDHTTEGEEQAENAQNFLRDRCVFCESAGVS